MKPANYNKDRMVKWGLFSALVLTMGFNLSMNPEHFNNVVRIEKATVTELASRSRNRAETRAQEGEEAVESKVYTARNGDTRLRVTVEEKNDRVTAKFEKTEGETCYGLCGSTKVLDGIESLNNAKDIAAAIERIVDDAKANPKVDEDVASDDSQKVHYNFSKWTRACSKMHSTLNLSCSVDALVRMSKELKNDEEQDARVMAFFDEYISSDLSEGLRFKRMRQNIRDYDVYADEMDTQEEEADKYETSKELALKLTEDLRSRNGKSVRKAIASMLKSSYRTNSMIARDMIREGKRLQDKKDPMHPEDLTRGFNMMTQGRNQLLAMQMNTDFDHSSFNDAIMNMDQATDREMEYYRRYFDGNFYDPTSKYFETLLGTPAKPLSYQDSLNKILGSADLAVATAQGDIDQIPTASVLTREALARRRGAPMIRRSADLPVIPSASSIPGTSYQPGTTYNPSAPFNPTTQQHQAPVGGPTAGGVPSPSARGM